MININRTEWPCVNTNATAACLICSPDKPCLFDLSQDEAERVNLAPQQPQLAAQLARQLATYTAYVDGKMTPEELVKSAEDFLRSCLVTTSGGGVAEATDALVEKLKEATGGELTLVWVRFE